MRAFQYSISKKLTWMNMLVSGTALLVACAAFIAYDMVTFREGMVRSLSIRSQIIGSNSVSALLFNDPAAGANTLSALEVDHNVLFAGIYTLEGQPFAEYWRDAEHPARTLPTIPSGQTQAYRFQDGELQLVHSIVFKGKPTGIVYIRSDLQQMNDRLKRYGAIVAAVLLASLSAALFISWTAQRAISRPIVDLAEIARTVSQDRNYSTRATPLPDRGELTILIEAFNEMLAQIEERDRALQMAQTELEQRVEERTTELLAANKELEAFSYSVSHDLRAPLRSIDGFSQILLEDYADKVDAGAKDCLQRVRAATQRMAALIDDLLKLAQVTRSEMRRETLDLSAIAKSIAVEIQEDEPRRVADFAIENGLMVEGDSHLLRVAMENLLGNAWKYTSHHDCARIEFGCNHQEAGPIYFVRDDGAGFDPRYVDRLFGAFQRLHKTSEFAGTGIGLATVQRIIRRHGGKIWAEGAVEKGATFYFTL